MGRVVDVTLQLVDRMTGPLEKAGSRLAAHANQYVKAGRQIQNAGKNISAVGSSMTKKMTMPIAAAGGACVKLASDFESGMSKVSSISGATGKQLQKLSDKAKEMGAKTKFSATEATEAYQYMAMAGWKTKDMLAGIQGVMTLAGASGESLATTSDIVTDALTAFGMTAKDTSRFTDVMAAASANANTNVAMLGESFKYAAPVAGALGFSVEDVSLALGTMANSGIKASSAGTSLRSLLTNMAKPTENSAAAMKKLGISLTDSKGKTKSFSTIMQEMRKGFAGLSESQKAQTAAALAGKTGMSGLLAIVNASDKDFNKLSNSIMNSKDACQKMYDVANDNLTGQLTILKSTVESIAISFGEKLAPYVKVLTGHIQNLANRFNSLTDAQQDTIIKVLGIVAAVGPSVLIFGKMVTGIGRVVSVVGKLGKAIRAAGSVMGLITSPAGIVIAVLAGIALAAFLIIKNWNRVKPFVMQLKNTFLETFGGAGGVIDIFKTAFISVMKTLGSAVKSLFPLFKSMLVPILNGLVSTIKKLMPVIRQLAVMFAEHLAEKVRMFADVLKKILPVVIDVAGKLTAALVPVLESVMGLVQKLVPIITDALMGAVKAVSPVIQTITNVIQKLVPLIAGILMKAIKALIPVINTVAKAVSKVVPIIGKLLSKAVKALISILTKTMKVIGRVAGTIGGVLVKMIKKLSPVLDKMGKMFSKIFNKVFSTVSKVIKKLQPLFEGIGIMVEKAMSVIGPAVSAAFDHIGNVITIAVEYIGGLFDNLMDIFGGVIDFITGVFSGNWSQAWDGIVSIFKGIFNMIPLAVEAVVNLVISAVNLLISGINNLTGKIGIPSIPEIPTVTLPRLARGTDYWQGGLVQVSERGGEIIDLPKGSRVYPHDKSVDMAREEGRRQGRVVTAAAQGGGSMVNITIPKLADTIVVRDERDIDAIAEAFVKKLEKVSLNVGGGEIGYSH